MELCSKNYETQYKLKHNDTQKLKSNTKGVIKSGRSVQRPMKVDQYTIIGRQDLILRVEHTDTSNCDDGDRTHDLIRVESRKQPRQEVWVEIPAKIDSAQTNFLSQN